MYLLTSLALVTGVVQAAAFMPSHLDARAPSPPPPTCSNVPVPHPPAGAHCGVKGRLRRRNVLFRSNVAHAANPLHACRDLCMEHPSCLSFAYKKTTGLCRAFASSLSTQGIYDLGNSNGNLFYSRKCYATKCETPGASCVSAALTAPTAITAYSDGTSDRTYENSESFVVPLPFDIGYGAYKTSRAIMNLDGYLSTDDSPNPDLYWGPFVQPMEIDYGKDQGLFYEIVGKAPNRIVKFEWRTTELEAGPTYGVQKYSSILQLYEADGYSATFSYPKISDDGGKAYVGVANGASNEDNYYSQLEPGKIVTGLTLNVDNDDQTFVVSTLPLCPVV